MRRRAESLDNVVLPVPDNPKKTATSPPEPMFAEQCIGSTRRSGNR